MAAPDDAAIIDASRRLLHPGLVNAHTHGHGNLARSMGDRWTLELLLAAAPHMSPYQSVEEKRVSATIGAAEMLLKGCTACYDLFVEFPLPTEEGIAAVAEAYAQAGMRAVIAPMMADMTVYEAIPGLMEALPPHLRTAVGATRPAAVAGDAGAHAGDPAQLAGRPRRWSGRRSRRPFRCTAVTNSWSPAAIWPPNSMSASTPSGRVQDPGRGGRATLRPIADRAYRAAWPAGAALRRRARRVAG